MKKVLLINGSPHKAGCTFTALEEIARQLEKDGVASEIVHIGDGPHYGCIGCGACVASCKNASAMLFTSAKIAHLNLLPQGQPERSKRVLAMMKQMEAEGFGNCTNQYECEAACPKGISVDNIARLNRDFMRANAKEGLCF